MRIRRRPLLNVFNVFLFFSFSFCLVNENANKDIYFFFDISMQKCLQCFKSEAQMEKRYINKSLIWSISLTFLLSFFWYISSGIINNGWKFYFIKIISSVRCKISYKKERKCCLNEKESMLIWYVSQKAENICQTLCVRPFRLKLR